MRSQIFIGSSKEGLQYVEQVKKQLEPVGDFISWITSFAQNRGALDNLIKKAKLSEFAILIATKDDTVFKRGDLRLTARDNIIFEFGLFLGATGIDHAFLLAEEGVQLPSDLDGITVSWFSGDPSKPNSLEKACTALEAHIRHEQQSSQLGLLPSTALAIGYYHSFVNSVCTQIQETDVIKMKGRLLQVRDFRLHIIIPNVLDHNGVIDFSRAYNKMHGLKQAHSVATSAATRDYPFQFKIDPDGQKLSEKLTLKLFDVPTTLNTINESVKLYLPSEKVGYNGDHEYLKSRELKNFKRVLDFLVAGSAATRNRVIVADNVVL